MGHLGGVEHGHAPGDCPQAPVQLRRAGEGAETAVVRQAPHHDHPVHQLAVLDDVGEPEVHVGSEAAVELELGGGGVQPESRCH